MEAKPHVLVIEPEQTTRVLLVAELVERGCDVVGATDLVAAAAYRGYDVLLVDEQVLTTGAVRFLEAQLARRPNVAVLLLASALVEVPHGPWHRVLRRPLTVGGLATDIVEAAHEPPAAHP